MQAQSNMTEIPVDALATIQGGDWFETTWGVALGSAFVAGFMGTGGFMVVALASGAVLVLGQSDWLF